MSATEKGSVPDDLPDNDLIEIYDPEIDPAQIMDEIRERITNRRAELGYITQKFGSFGGSQFPGRPDDIPYDPDFYDHLELANELYRQVDTSIDLQPSPALRIPVLGSLWAIIREQAHQLVAFYVNRALNHQMGVNREIVSVLNKLEAINREQSRAIDRLQKDVNLLRQKLEDQKK